MEVNSNLLSLRIFTADYYMCAPIKPLDGTYSEFRGEPIKQVPIIRVFGTNTNGTKCCMNIHGVFPYLYIPYQGNTDDAAKFSYQIAISLDKAINISLGQANSSSQHVFKVVLVKGIPFYGFHSNEHQFLKIYLYNPSFIRKASTLLQNGAILSKIYQPHESHLPFILQFMIDYNLYGMSFIHVPLEVVRYRFDTLIDGIIPHEYILSKNIERQTTASKLELDIPCSYILNRYQLNNCADMEHANPGIAFLWRDERTRRSKLLNLPDVNVPKSQEQKISTPTDSDLIYRTELAEKLTRLRSMNTSGFNDTQSTIEQINNSNVVDRRTFNLQKLLSNSVYATECPTNNVDSQAMMNASFIEPHLSNISSFEQIHGGNSKLKPFACDSIVDVEMVKVLSQPMSNLDETLNENEYALLAAMESLDTDVIEENSILAPLTQSNALPCNQVNLKTSDDINNITSKIVPNENDAVFDDLDDDLFNDFTMNFDLNETLKMSDSLSGAVKKTISTLPQFDGGHDNICTKVPAKKLKLSKRAAQSKYPPLNVTTIKSPVKSLPDFMANMLKNKPEITLTPIGTASQTNKITPSISQSVAVIDLANNDDTTDLKEEITSSLPSSSKFDKILKKTPVVKIKKISVIDDIVPPSQHASISPPKFRYKLRSRNPATKTTKKCNRKTYNDAAVSDTLLYEDFNDTTSLSLELQSNWSTCDVARAYDIRMNFFPEPSTSKCNFYKYVDIPGYHWNSTLNEILQPSLPPVPVINTFSSPCSDDNNESMLCAQSFYEPNDIFDNTSTSFSQFSPKIDDNEMKLENLPLTKSNDNDNALSMTVLNQLERNFGTTSPTDFYSITLQKLPPSKNECLTNMHMHDLTECIHPKPFYSDISDVTRRKEIGGILLDIPSNQISDLEEFHSLVLDSNSEGLYAWRQQKIKDIFQETTTDDVPICINRTREILASEKTISIRLHNKSPTKANLHEWLKVGKRELTNKIKSSDNLVTPPKANIKLRLNTVDNVNSDNDDDNSYSSDDLIMLTPLNDNKDLTTQTLNTTNHIDKVHSDNDDNCNSDDCIILSSQDDEKKLTTQTLNKTHSNNNDCINNSSDCTKKLNISKTPKVWKFKQINRIAKKRKVKILTNDSTDNDFIKIKQNKLCINNNINNNCESPNLFDDPVIATDEDNHKSNAEIQKTDHRKENGIFDINRNTKISGHINTTITSTAAFLNNLTINDSCSNEHSFGITGATLENTFGFKMDLDNYQTAKADLEHNFLTIMSLECHIQTRGNLKPDPNIDKITCIFYAIENDIPITSEDDSSTRITGMIIVNDLFGKLSSSNLLFDSIVENCHVKYVPNEMELFLQLVHIINECDPDIYAGYEIEMASWGYVIQRGYIIEINMPTLMSRLKPSKQTKSKIDNTTHIVDVNDHRPGDEFGDYEPGIRLVGRVLLDVWRILRSEITLSSYTFENVMYHIMHRRYPLNSHKNLTKWWTKFTTRSIVIEYYLKRIRGTLELLNQLDLISRTCELAKLFGIQFYEVLSRGSQFRVESMMLRIAKPRNIIPVSPSVQQRAHMRAPEYLPLILEPQSRMYNDPIIVLDFQSLYPSIIIAYNYCFSTCLGRVEHLGQSQPFEFGASQLRVSPNLVQELLDKNCITVSPCGAAFVKSEVREGVLPRMLREILDTRLMVKQSMKLHKSNKTLQRILHSRQLGLKLMANVTYGYTAANFSGRMPCVEVGDSVVSKGRETLERAIRMVETNEIWRSKVVYGDTDSLFVLVPGRSRDEAFRIGAEIAAAVTENNPYPIKLKLEKVYQPSILQTKKRYVGYMYETPDQSDPIYEAKGIETVRRDGCPAVAKMLEKTLKILFDTCDVSAVKRYVCRQFTKIMSGRANIQDLIFAKEFRGLNGYKPGACVPALELTKKWKQIDQRAEPRRGERVPYLIVNGPPGVPLIRLVRSPHEYLEDDGLRINAVYYITKAIIPPLNRCLLLIGADVNQWYAELPKRIQATTSYNSIESTNLPYSSVPATKKSTISQYFASTACVTDCGAQTKNGLCLHCLKQPNQTAIILANKINSLERKLLLVNTLCQSCCKRSYDIDCKSLDCPVLFVKSYRQRDAKQVSYLRELLQEKCTLKALTF